MKKIFFILLSVVNVNLSYSQCACCGSSSNISAGEVTPTAYALAKKQVFGELYSDLRYFDPPKDLNLSDHHNLSNTALKINSMLITTVGLRYGLTNRATLLIQQPYLFINARPTSSKAFGDLLSLINYKAFDKSNFIIGLQLGMEWPTGEYLQAGNGNAISTGSGSFDPVAGVNLMKSFSKSALRLNGFFKYTTRGFNATNYGDFFGHQLGYSYFLSNREAMCMDTNSAVKKSAKPTLALNVQLSGEWSQPQWKDHAMVDNTGSYVALASAGLTLGYKGFTIPVLVSLPFCQKYNGLQNQNTFRLRIGLTKTFN